MGSARYKGTGSFNSLRHTGEFSSAKGFLITERESNNIRQLYSKKK